MLIGLTGGISTGKSTVAKIFLKYEIPVIDADKIAREIVQPNKKAWKQIVENFGQGILHTDLSINREEPSNIIFKSNENRNKLDSITHPIILSEILAKASILEKKHDLVIVDIPLLYETNSQDIFDKIIVVYVDNNKQLLRLIKRDNISEEMAKLKIDAQLDINIKKDRADILINNNYDYKNTEQQVKKIINLL